MASTTKPIVRPGTPVDKTPFELLAVAEDSEVAIRWREDMDRIAESERAVEEEASKIHIR